MILDRKVHIQIQKGHSYTYITGNSPSFSYEHAVLQAKFNMLPTRIERERIHCLLEWTFVFVTQIYIVHHSSLRVHFKTPKASSRTARR